MREEKEWLCNAYDAIGLGASKIESIHVDEFLHIDIVNISPDEKLKCIIRTFNVLSEILETKNSDDYLLYIDVGLKEISNKVQGVVKDEEELIHNIDRYDVPEIFLTKYQVTKEIPLLEFYRCPLPFILNGLNKHGVVVYKEYRGLADMHDKNSFSRELNIVFRSLNKS